MIKRGTTYPRNLHRGMRKIHMLVRDGRVIYMSPEMGHTVLEEWLRQNVVTKPLTVSDAAGDWFEMELTIPPDFAGTPETGWYNGPLSLSLHYSKNLTSWSQGGWIPAPGKATQTLANGWKKWFVRYLPVPRVYKGALVDFRMTTSRYGKAITALKVNGTTLSLPAYPYAMPSQAATLQAHLVAAGYTGATVTTTAGTWRATIQNYGLPGTEADVNFEVTWAGSQIAELRNANTDNSLVALPGYPYSMPGQEAALEADLIAAGFPYAQVTLFQDEWRIFLPNITCVGTTRTFEAVITPPDPLQMWTFFGTSAGVDTQGGVSSAQENVRIGGAVMPESDKAFGRLGVTASG